MLLARCVINDYIDALGFSQVALDQRPESPLGERKVFEPAEVIPIGKQPKLPDDEINYPGMFVLDWLVAFHHLATGNAGHSAGSEITPEQNKELGDILSSISGIGGAAAA